RRLGRPGHGPEDALEVLEVGELHDHPASSTTQLDLHPGVELEELLSAHLDTRVSITMGGSKGAKGKVTIEFATLEDLERIYRAMTPTRVAPD
ncbi:MAG TPA: hypothetical protein VHF91_12130, partial [Acidimicrobiales bacterium]|nr:hypothetical protein [Acidimicrobiales bacterium]